MRIDPHEHLRDEEQSYKETIAHGLKVAKEQGVDIVLDMPNVARPVIDEKRLKERLALVPKGEEERYYAYIGATKNEEQLKKAVELAKSNERVCGIKLYAGKSTGNLEIIEEEAQKKVYETLADCGYTGVIAVHCEKESEMKKVFDPKNPFTHGLARPNEAEIESVRDQIKFATQTNFKGTFHVCHISCKKTIELVEETRRKGKIKITCGATPHHSLWSNEMFKRPDGLLYRTVPPLRSPEDNAALREALVKGKIDWIETDHAPHAVGEKLFAGYPNGFPSLYLYKKFVEETLPSWGISERQIEDLTYKNIVKTYGIKV